VLKRTTAVLHRWTSGLLTERSEKAIARSAGAVVGWTGLMLRFFKAQQHLSSYYLSCWLSFSRYLCLKPKSFARMYLCQAMAHARMRQQKTKRSPPTALLAMAGILLICRAS
jgi:hypothetical protein